MTIAVCWKCGAMKRGAFNPCLKCNSAPITEDELAVSMELSDHCFEKNQLEQMGARIASGTKVTLAPENRKNIIKTLRDSEIFSNVPKTEDIDYKPNRPWWKRFFR